MWRLLRLQCATNLGLISIQQRAAATLQFVTFSPPGVAAQVSSICLSACFSFQVAMLGDGYRSEADHSGVSLAFFHFVFYLLCQTPAKVTLNIMARYVFLLLYFYFFNLVSALNLEQPSCEVSLENVGFPFRKVCP